MRTLKTHDAELDRLERRNERDLADLMKGVRQHRDAGTLPDQLVVLLERYEKSISDCATRMIELEEV